MGTAVRSGSQAAGEANGSENLNCSEGSESKQRMIFFPLVSLPSQDIVLYAKRVTVRQTFFSAALLSPTGLQEDLHFKHSFFIFQHLQLSFHNQKFSTFIKETEDKPREGSVLSSAWQVMEPPATRSLPVPTTGHSCLTRSPGHAP